MFSAQLLAGAVARVDHAALALADGSVLIAGGYDEAGAPRADCQRWDAARAALVAAAPLPAPSARLSLSPLPDGSALAVGVGAGGAARYLPAADRWEAAPPPLTPRLAHAAVVGPAGDLWIIGGRAVDDDDGALGAVERFEPDRGAWQAAPPLIHPRRSLSAFALPDGALLAVAGKAPAAAGPAHRLDHAELLPVGAAAWRPTRRAGTLSRFAGALPDGRVLAYGGYLYEPGVGRWRPVEAGWRGGGPLLALADGRVACFSAQGEEVFDPTSGQWSPVGPSRRVSQRGHSATALADGRALLVGGAAGRGGGGAPYAALVEVDLGWRPQELELEALDSAEKLIHTLHELEAVAFEDLDACVDELVEPVARALAYGEGGGGQASALSRLLLEHEGVEEVFIGDEDLRRLLARW